MTSFTKQQLRATVLVGGLIAASLSIRVLSWISAPASTRGETEAIFIFLTFTVLLIAIVVLRYVDNTAIRAGTAVVSVLLLSSSIGALTGSLGAKVPGTKAPTVFHFHQPLHITSTSSHGGREEVRVQILFNGDKSLEKFVAEVAAGDLQLYLRIPASCVGSCEMSVLDPQTGRRVPATRRPSDFEIRFRNGFPFQLDASVPVTLVFEFSEQITLYARDIGLPASARSDRLFHSGQEVSIPYDRLIFARFMFLDGDGKPHSAIY